MKTEFVIKNENNTYWGVGTNSVTNLDDAKRCSTFTLAQKRIAQAQKKVAAPLRVTIVEVHAVTTYKEVVIEAAPLTHADLS